MRGQQTPTATVATLAGSNSSGSMDGIGTSASFQPSAGVAVDSSGNVYVADGGNNKIRKITPAGVVTTLAGSGAAGSADNAGTAASFMDPNGVAVDRSGNVYVADTYNNEVRMVDPNGIVTTLAGAGLYGFGSTDGVGRAASFCSPCGIAVDGSGNVYVADTFNHEIRKISPGNVVTTLAGSGNRGSTDGAGTAASFDHPYGLAVDSSGNVYVADTYNNEIRKIGPGAVVTTLAGSHYAQGSNDGNGTAASFFAPVAVAVDTFGAVYVADSGNNKIRMITPTGVVTTLAGSGVNGSTDGTATQATFNNPCGVAADASGNFYVTDAGTRVREIIINPIPDTAPAFSLQPLDALVVIGGTTMMSVSVTGQPVPTLQWQVSLDSGASWSDLSNGGPYSGVDQQALTFTGTPVALSECRYRCVASNRAGTTISHAATIKVKMVVVTTLAGSGTAGSEDGPGTGTVATFNAPGALTVDTSGNVYVADSNNLSLRKVDPTGVVTSVVGNYSSVQGVAADIKGSLYVADQTGNRIWKIDRDGTARVMAGSPGGSSGWIDAWGVNARFNQPRGVTVDATGNVFVADSSNNLIRMISPDGNVTTYAGTSIAGSMNANRLGATFSLPAGVAVDASGNVYVADAGNNLIRRIAADGLGMVTTLAGSGTAGSTDGVGSAATFNNPTKVAVDSAGYVYVVEQSSHVRRISPTGDVTTFAQIASPGGIASDASGEFYISDGYSEIWRVSPAGVATVFAGTGASGSANGMIAVASFEGPIGVAFDVSGSIYVADSNEIRKVSPAGLVTTLAGNANTGSADGTGTNASFLGASGVAFDSSGNLYVADSGNNKIRKISPEGLVTTLAGSGIQGSTDGQGSTASFYLPKSVATDSAGNVFVADTGNNKIRKVSPGGVVTTLAGATWWGFADGAGSAASFYAPAGVAVDAAGNIYVADSSNCLIRKVSPAGVVTTLAGNRYRGSTDGTGTAATFNAPSGVAVDASGNIYVADLGNNKIRMVSQAGEVTTLPGSGNAGSVDDAGDAASFNYPSGVAVNELGDIYVADSWNCKIRKISSAARLASVITWPTPAAIEAGTPLSSIQLNAGYSRVLMGPRGRVAFEWVMTG